MIIHFVPEAQAEFLDAVSYYEGARSGLGQRFKDEVDRCLHWIRDHHDLYRVHPQGHRRVNLRVFPYSIPFLTREDILWVLAVAHHSRRPLYWIQRKPGSLPLD